MGDDEVGKGLCDRPADRCESCYEPHSSLHPEEVGCGSCVLSPGRCRAPRSPPAAQAVAAGPRGTNRQARSTGWREPSGLLCVNSLTTELIKMLEGAPEFGFCKPNEWCYTAEEEKWCSGRLCISLEFIYPNWKKHQKKPPQNVWSGWPRRRSKG